MGKSKLDPWSVAGLVITALIDFVGGWLMLNKLLGPCLVSQGTHASRNARESGQ